MDDEWWNQFGLNPVGINPDVTELGKMFLFHNRNLGQYSDLIL
jgi:hypothetical protein